MTTSLPYRYGFHVPLRVMSLLDVLLSLVMTSLNLVTCTVWQNHVPRKQFLKNRKYGQPQTRIPGHATSIRCGVMLFTLLP